jgi:hemoglobin-like flavoprotein
MTTKQIQLIKMSFARIAPVAEPVAAAFYARLFELDPGLRSMFPVNLDDQGLNLMKMLGAAVGMLNRPEALIPALEALARRHNGYGVRDEHYDTVGEALLWTLERGLGPLFTDEVREAWTVLYQVVSTTMQKAARAEPALLLG